MNHEQLKKFFGEAFASAIVGHDSSDPQVKGYAARMVEFFDGAVDTLRNSETFPNRYVNELVTLMWRLIGNRMVPMVAGPVATLSFVAMGQTPQGMLAAVMAPEKWPDMFEEDPVYQLGGIVFTASQVRDWYNDKLNANPEKVADENVVRRAKCYEAEYLLTIIAMEPTCKFNDWQDHVLEVAPLGVKSLGDLDYESKPFEMGPESPLWQLAKQNTKQST